MTNEELQVVNELLKAVKVALEKEENGLIDFEQYGFSTDADIARFFRETIIKAESLLLPKG